MNNLHIFLSIKNAIGTDSSLMDAAALGCCISSIAVQNMGNKSIDSKQVKKKLLEVTNDNF